MKKYYGYSETGYKTRWDYFKKKGYVYNRSDVRFDCRFISFCNKKQMVETIGNMIASKNWVRERVCETGNDTEIKLCNENIGYILVLDCTKSKIQIIDKIPI